MAGLFDGATEGDVIQAAEDWLGTMPTDKERLALLRKLGKILEPQDELEFPEALQGTTFQSQWQKYLEYRRNRSVRLPVTRRALEGVIRRLKDCNEERACEALQRAEDNGTQGVFPEKQNGHNRTDDIRQRDWS